MARRPAVERARHLRRTMTLPEVKLWQVLRARPRGIKFRRQHPLGRYVLDFYCPVAKLAIEMDGLAHELGDNPMRDVDHDREVAALGISTLRLAASDVLEHFGATVAHIVARCAPPLHHPSDGPPPHAKHGEDES